ncbi:hypothetical protein MN608_08676 [Microdochium nivale]|nr:hypothetical protein MN608_08676 [Microdochium nivale]
MATQMLIQTFSDFCDHIVQMRLVQLTIDLERCYCPSGCCRLGSRLIEVLSTKNGWKDACPKTIVIYGLVGDAERAHIETMLFNKMNNTRLEHVFLQVHSL